ncbi:hypothetical protein GRS96_01590 [Rathayibacter sp. VKM Ac-2803]|uniref:hypothetical protein n=1 Tax=Rathayibacter sp. VKM Ac-2803 TaxID=2609256 RepID=UPI00135CABF8|nr:hypothetical protein [Rathayibacter sp. VKM Ac-2803]MWV47964.1 hypothetical protein [Rathayibacter sp. VKM Ac-2803]
MDAFTRRTLGAVAVILGSPIALVTFGIGWIQEGWEVPVVQCQRSDHPPGMPLEGGNVSGERIWYPLGLSCTYEDGSRSVTVNHYNSDATVAFTASAAVALLGVVTLATARTRKPAPALVRVEPADDEDTALR